MSNSNQMYPIFAPRTKKENHTNTTVARATTIASAPDSITDNNDSAPDSITDNNDDSTSDIIVIHGSDSESDEEEVVVNPVVNPALLLPPLQNSSFDERKPPALPQRRRTAESMSKGQDDEDSNLTVSLNTITSIENTTSSSTTTTAVSSNSTEHRKRKAIESKTLAKRTQSSTATSAPTGPEPSSNDDASDPSILEGHPEEEGPTEEDESSARSYNRDLLRKTENKENPDMLAETFCKDGIHDVEATYQYFVQEHTNWSTKQVSSWTRYFSMLKFDPNKKFMTCYDYIKEANPSWTNKYIEGLSFSQTKRIMGKLGFSTQNGAWNIHHLQLKSMGGSDNPRNLRPLRYSNHRGTHLILPLIFRNYELSKPLIWYDVSDIAKLLDADEVVLADMNKAYIEAISRQSICMVGNTNATKGKGSRPAMSIAMMGKAGHSFAHTSDWSYEDRFDAALMKMSTHPNLSQEAFLKQTGYAPSDDSKYLFQFSKMITRINENGIATMKPTSDDAVHAYNKLKQSYGTGPIPKLLSANDRYSQQVREAIEQQNVGAPEPTNNDEFHEHLKEMLYKMVKAPPQKLEAVFNKLKDGNWYSVKELVEVCGYANSNTKSYRRIISGMKALNILEKSKHKLRFNDNFFKFGR